MHRPYVLMPSAVAASRVSELARRADTSSGTRGLVARRRQINRDSAASRTAAEAGPAGVVLYALCDTGGDPGGHLAQAHGLAAASGWAVVASFADTTGDIPPALRPGWARAQHTVRTGAAWGIVAVSRAGISRSDPLYRAELEWFAIHGAGLWLVRAETAS
ncbi:hypothetical protein ACWF94_28650 [Streptomyces sp. NPDC055078]